MAFPRLMLHKRVVSNGLVFPANFVASIRLAAEFWSSVWPREHNELRGAFEPITWCRDSRLR